MEVFHRTDGNLNKNKKMFVESSFFSRNEPKWFKMIQNELFQSDLLNHVIWK